jgi:hypothetical protein
MITIENYLCASLIAIRILCVQDAVISQIVEKNVQCANIIFAVLATVIIKIRMVKHATIVTSMYAAHVLWCIKHVTGVNT